MGSSISKVREFGKVNGLGSESKSTPLSSERTTDQGYGACEERGI